MKYLSINSGKDKIEVSRIVLGTDYFGTTVGEDTAFRLMDIYVEEGGNCLDTARVYASWLPNGEGASERTVGKWLRSRGNRNNIIISTKGGHPPIGHMDQGRLSRRELEKDLDESLRALGTDYIDIYWLHRDDATHPVEDIMETLASFIAKGKVRAIGCSNWQVGRIEEANRFAAQSGLTPFCSSQIQWSLASTTPEAYGDLTLVCMNKHEYEWYLKNSFPVFAYSSQAKGFFARAAADGLEAINQKAKSRFSSPENIARLEKVKKYATESGLTVTAVVLGYILCNRVPAVAVVGCKNTGQMRDSLAAADVSLSQDIIKWLGE